MPLSIESNNCPIYLDYHATTPVDRRVADRVYHYMTAEFGNASSIDHEWGDRSAEILIHCLRTIERLMSQS
jgi:cysteine desulfurase